MFLSLNYAFTTEIYHYNHAFITEIIHKIRTALRMFSLRYVNKKVCHEFVNEDYLEFFHHNLQTECDWGFNSVPNTHPHHNTPFQVPKDGFLVLCLKTTCTHQCWIFHRNPVFKLTSFFLPIWELIHEVIARKRM